MNDDFLSHWRDPALYTETLDADLLLQQVFEYLYRRAETPRLGLVLHGSAVTEREIDGLLFAVDPHTAATALIAAKLDRWN
jgi:hypothetical protein